MASSSLANLVVPSRVLRLSGRALRAPDGNATILANGDTSENAVVVLDYGRCEGGFPVLEIGRAQGPGPIIVRVTYSESVEAIDCDKGDGPFFLFSNAMNSYRVVLHTIEPSTDPQTLQARHTQRSQRYQKLELLTRNASVVFSCIGLRLVRSPIAPKARFHSSNETLNRIWKSGVRTLDMCSVVAGETEPAWDVTDIGTRVYGQHWAPCRQGTRWADKVVTFQCLVENGGAAWGINMVVNGLIFCLDAVDRKVSAYVGLADEFSVFPSVSKGARPIDDEIDLSDWLNVSIQVNGSDVCLSINGQEIWTVEDLRIHPILGGDLNSGSVAFGGPEGWTTIYRHLLVKDSAGSLLYENDMLPASRDKTLADFQVGTNSVACTVDGAKRDRACFGGDLFVSGRAIAFSGMDMDAVAGSIQLLSSYQMPDGYLGSLCPIQAPLHGTNDLPPTYAFYSMTYSLLLLVAARDYWLVRGYDSMINKSLPAFNRLLHFVDSHTNAQGLVAAPPHLSMHWFPMGGPVFGVSGGLNLAYYDALQAMRQLTTDSLRKSQLRERAEKLKESMILHLWDSDSGIFRMGSSLAADGLCQDVNAYAKSLGITPTHEDDLSHLIPPGSGLPVAFRGLGNWDKTKVVSPYATGFAVEALFKMNQGKEAVRLTEQVWGGMVDPSKANYSGGQWEAMKLDGSPFGDDTSLNHAWSTWPVFLLPQYLAGLKPLEPGWRSFTVEPILSAVDLVDYSIETDLGLISVGLRVHDKGGSASITVSAPAGTSFEIRVPPGYAIDGSTTGLGPLDKVTFVLERQQRPEEFQEKAVDAGIWSRLEGILSLALAFLGKGRVMWDKLLNTTRSRR